MKEQLNLVDGLGLIRIVGDSFETALFVDTMPIALFWNNNEGSIEQLLARAHPGPVDSRLSHLRTIAAGQLAPSTPLTSQVWFLLELLENGHYEIALRTLGKTWDVIDFSRDKLREIDGFYPLDSFVATASGDLLSKERVDFYVSVIERGERPIAFVVAGAESNTAFVVDGHHKLAAYQACKAEPVVIEVRRLHPPALDPQLELSFFLDASRHSILEHARELGRRGRAWV